MLALSQAVWLEGVVEGVLALPQEGVLALSQQEGVLALSQDGVVALSKQALVEGVRACSSLEHARCVPPW